MLRNWKDLIIFTDDLLIIDDRIYKINNLLISSSDRCLYCVFMNKESFSCIKLFRSYEKPIDKKGYVRVRLRYLCDLKSINDKSLIGLYDREKRYSYLNKSKIRSGGVVITRRMNSSMYIIEKIKSCMK